MELERLVQAQRLELQLLNKELTLDDNQHRDLRIGADAATSRTPKLAAPMPTTSKLASTSTKRKLESDLIPLPPLPPLQKTRDKPDEPKRKVLVAQPNNIRPVLKSQTELNKEQTKQRAAQSSTLKDLKKKVATAHVTPLLPNQTIRPVEQEPSVAKKLPGHVKLSFNRGKTLPTTTDSNKENNQPDHSGSSTASKCTTMTELFGNDIDLSESE